MRLRQALDLEGTATNEHSQTVERISHKHSHTIKLIESEKDAPPWAALATCAPYALGIASLSDFYGAWVRSNLHAGKDFIRWLIAGKHLQEADGPAPGRLVFYYSEEWEHVGIVSEDGRVRSKWGTFPVYDHALWEVPSKYGDKVQFYVRPGAEDALELYLQYVSERELDLRSRPDEND